MTIVWLKAWHIIFMVTWFSGLFYLPRLFVYHAMAEDAISQARFKIMERKLFYGIATPGLILTVLFGAWLLAREPWYWEAGWLHIKLALVGLLVLFHGYCGYLVWVFRHDRNRRSHVFYRWINEFPVVVLIGVVILAVVKPG